MPAHDAGTERSMRTPLDCHKQPDLLTRRKERLGFATLIVCFAGVGLSLVLSEQGDFHSSRGPVASVHQIWDAQCNACHVPFTPISSHSWDAPFLDDSHASTQRCQACHDGPAHHVGQQPDLTCGSCHREHRGRDASLVNLPDRDCTQCHNDLGEHHAAKPSFELKITQFSSQGHPEFRSIRTDPGKLKFNHQRHLRAGMPIDKDGGALMTLGKIPEPFRKRYADEQAAKDDSAAVQLQCASCHQLDAGDAGGAAQGKRNAGAYMLPVSYENHCQACHPLTIERKSPHGPNAEHLTIPHRWKPGEIHDYLENHYTAQVARGKAGFLDQKLTRPLPGKTLKALEPTMREVIEQKVAHAEKDLYLSQRLCAGCHLFEGSVAEAIRTGQPPDLKIAPTQVPAVWFQHAKFNHTVHRAVQCAECHAGADRSTSSTDVLIPGRATCVQCHAPTTQVGTPGARFNCTQCHPYHNGAHGLQGIGAKRRNPKTQRDIDGFLRN